VIEPSRSKLSDITPIVMPRPSMPAGRRLMRCMRRPCVVAAPASRYIGLDGTTARMPFVFAMETSAARGTQASMTPAR
jgi:hypothetical protein